MAVQITCNVTFTSSYRIQHIPESDKRVLVVEHNSYGMSTVHYGIARCQLIMKEMRALHPFRSCSWYKLPPYDEWRPEIVIMDCGDTLPKEYEGKVEVMRAVWDGKGSVAYIRPEQVAFA